MKLAVDYVVRARVYIQFSLNYGMVTAIYLYWAHSPTPSGERLFQIEKKLRI